MAITPIPEQTPQVVLKDRRVAGAGTGGIASIPPSGGITLPADATKYYDGTGNFTVPSAGIGYGHSLFGDGTDGAMTLDGTATYSGLVTTTGVTPNLIYTLARDVALSGLTVNASKILIAPFRLFVNGTITNSGTIHNNGSDAAASVFGAGAVGHVLGGGTDGAAGVTTGTTSVTGGSSASYFGNVNTGNHALGGRGGNGGNNGAGGGAAGTLNTITKAPLFRDAVSAINQYFSVGPADPGSVPSGNPCWPAGGTGGGGGGRTTGGTATVAGGGGGGAGIILIVARNINNGSGVISANGGAGANATGGTCVTGGGGGGGGGGVILIYDTLTTGAETANGGARGTDLNSPGVASAVGSNGSVIKIQN